MIANGFVLLSFFNCYNFCLSLAILFPRSLSAVIMNDGKHQASEIHLPLFLVPSTNYSATRDNDARRLLGRSVPDPGLRRDDSTGYMRLYDDLLLYGYYTTHLWIGTPPQMFALIVDSGSTMTYIPCSTCEKCGQHQDPKFRPDLSSSYQPVKCNIDCSCDDDREQCVYERHYAESSSSRGVLGEDVVSFGNLSGLASRRAIFGCENEETGDLYSQRADGIMGMGRGDYSIVDQLFENGAINNSFSLCYGGIDRGGGAMILGSISPPRDTIFAYSDPARSPETFTLVSGWQQFLLQHRLEGDSCGWEGAFFASKCIRWETWNHFGQWNDIRIPSRSSICSF